ncbi:hypothetical protein BC332_31440 [Capsicum chinense]|nr:hypothetical protein BC332_31440 [Capsicum chinense]
MVRNARHGQGPGSGRDRNSILLSYGLSISQEHFSQMVIFCIFIAQVREVDGHKLVQIQNPWADEVEWNGPWFDPSPDWTDRMKHKLKHVPQANDGIFWMSWQDFQIHFMSIYVCRVYPPEMRYSIHGQWRGYSAGGCQYYDTWHQNPQYRLRASGPDASLSIHVFITLTQGVIFSKTTAGFRNYPSSHVSMMFYIGMRILKSRGRRAVSNIYLHEFVGGTDYVNSREISCEMVLDPDPKGMPNSPTLLLTGIERGERMVCPLRMDEASCLILGCSSVNLFAQNSPVSHAEEETYTLVFSNIHQYRVHIKQGVDVKVALFEHF